MPESASRVCMAGRRAGSRGDGARVACRHATSPAVLENGGPRRRPTRRPARHADDAPGARETTMPHHDTHEPRADVERLAGTLAPPAGAHECLTGYGVMGLP